MLVLFHLHGYLAAAKRKLRSRHDLLVGREMEAAFHLPTYLRAHPPDSQPRRLRREGGLC